jgi:hypothetical protein
VAKRDGVLGLAVMAGAALAVERPARTATVAAMAGAVPFPAIVQRVHQEIQNESRAGMPNELRFGAAFALADLLTLWRARQAE